MFSEDTGYFAVGRTTKATIEKFDPNSGNFVAEEHETSPYTHCVFNAAIGFIGIAKKSKLAPSAMGIANQIERLLLKTKMVADNEIQVEIPPIPDPNGFLQELRSAYRVLRYTATFHGPNPFDADEYFQKPLSKYLSAAKGQKGKAQISGVDLDRETLGAVTRSTAATGNQASARIRRNKKKDPVTINLKGDPVSRSYDEETHQPRVVLEELNTVYERIRKDERVSN